MLVLLVLVSLSSLVLSQEVPGVVTEPTQEEKNALKSYIATLDNLSGDTMRSLIKLNNSIPSLVKECERNSQQSERLTQLEPNVKFRRRIKVVYDALAELAYAVKELHYKSVDIMKVAMGTQSVQLATEVNGLKTALNKCENEKKAEAAERAKCEAKLPKLQSELDKAKKERDECKTEQKQLEESLKKCLENGLKEKTKLEDEVKSLREKCSKDNSQCDNVKLERDECLRKAEEDKKKHDNELKKCKDENRKSITGLQAEMDKCKSKDEACNKTKLERDQCQSELEKTKEKLDENVKKCETEADKLKKCEEGNQECEKLCQDAKKKLQQKLQKCNETLDDLQNKLNGTTSEVDRLTSEVDRLNASLSMCSVNPANHIETTTEQEMTTEQDTTTSLATTQPPPTTAQLPPANRVPGCEAFEIANNVSYGGGGEVSFIIGKRQYIVNAWQQHSWQKSRDICSSKGMTMLQLETQAEFEQLIPKIRSLFTTADLKTRRFPFYWIGAKRKGPPSGTPIYEWVCGGAFMQIRNFPSAPKFFSYLKTNHECGSIYVAPAAIGVSWWPDVCTENKYYVCEKPLL